MATVLRAMPFCAVALLHVTVRGRVPLSTIEVRDSAGDIVGVLSPIPALEAAPTHTHYHTRTTVCQRAVVACVTGTNLRFSRLELRLVDACDGFSMYLDSVRVALGNTSARAPSRVPTSAR